ncbi:hypothetical protein [Methylomonas albis]|uniref:Uncharacterized protein n=1 Tax=Methylomonas albis TaxID=1854563 RepID=A0ABR9D5V3_9GAMM|nr:hypothetical protein [Methylomonas albis]MBD9358161.1 hypothetical protein [Methylomonas albis]
MSMILLHNPIASSRSLQRVHMFPGRHLGEEEFDREQAYADARLANVLQGKAAGIVHGLDLQLGPNGVAEPGFSVSSGLALAANGQALGLYYPPRAEWQDLIDSYLNRTQVASAVGVYYLLLTRGDRQIDGPGVDPCQRTELDPTRDTQRVLAGSLALQRINISDAAVNTWPRDRIENWVAADRVDAGFMAKLGHAVPLALLAVVSNEDASYRIAWLSQEAGRYEAMPNSGYRVLLNQSGAAMRRVMQAAGLPANAGIALPQFLQDNLHLDFLPAAGQLPLDWLQNPAAPAPNLLWLPTHLGIDMVPVPEEAVIELLNGHIARRVIDLRQPAGDKIRLLLAVNEPDYRPNLLDIPQTDSVLESDIFRFYMRAYEAWRKWRQQFDALYFVEPSNTPPLAGGIGVIEHAVLDPAQFKNLDLPKPEMPPALPLTIFEKVIARANSEQQDPQNPGTPYPYSKGVPALPNFYSNWLGEDGNPPPIATPSDDGLVVQYAVALVELEAIENQIRAIRSRVEKTRDFLLLQRQQLDSQTVALAALAGGVAGDGTGLQVARWLPYANLNATDIPNNVDKAVSTESVVSNAPKAVFATASAGLFNSAISQMAAPKISASSALSNNLLSNALASTSSVSKSAFLLTSKPQTYSAFELGINKNRLDMLSRITKEAVSKPAFEAKEYRFGVIDHISPEINEYAKAYYGMKELLATLTDLFDPTDAATLRKQMEKIGVVEDDQAGANATNPFERSGKLESPTVLDNLADKNAPNNPQRSSLLKIQYRYHALFKAGRILTQWIAIFEARYNNIERKLQGKLREQANKLAQIDKLAGLIRVARETLEGMDRFRVEQLGDYGVAQRLLDEDWRQVWTLNNERTRILTKALRGLYYVRVRGTPVSAALADPLALRYGSRNDIVPGCDWEEEVDLPAALDPFFAAICEIPMDDWASLKPLRPKLPPFQQFDYLGQLRQARFKARPASLLTPANTDTLQARLQTVHLQTQIVMQQWASFSLPAFTASSLQTQAAAAKVLALADLVGAAGPLRKPAHELREQLEHCQFCLLEKLNLLPPSLRLQWGQLAEDDQIRVEDVSWWPGMDRAEADDFNAVRTVSELIAWWFRQLDRDASAASRSAMRNMIRAVLIHASLGDPQEIIRGNVHVPPRLAAIGERLQVKLNRPPLPGTRLQLLDTEQRVVAVLAVEDHSPQSTQVTIVDMLQSGVKINTRFSVVANKLTQQRL